MVMRDAFPTRCSRLRLTALSLVLLQAGCGGESGESLGTLPRADDPESMDDGVSAYGMRYPLTAAIGEIWGRRTAWPEHFNVDYLLTNGPFAVTPIQIDGESTSVRRPAGASVVLRAEFYSPGGRSFGFADYAFLAAPTEAPEAAVGGHFFTAARVGVDGDDSGNVEEAEMREVIDGTISFDGASTRRHRPDLLPRARGRRDGARQLRRAVRVRQPSR